MSGNKPACIFKFVFWVTTLSGISFLAGCFVPPTAIMQGASTTDPGHYRITPYYSYVSETGEDSDKLADQFGAHVGVGLGEKSEMQFRYDRIKVAGSESGYNFTGIPLNQKWNIFRILKAGTPSTTWSHRNQMPSLQMELAIGPLSGICPMFLT
jgi:hypothetical protein